MSQALTIETNSLAAWIKASRPKTLGAICCPVWMGSAFAFAHGSFSTTLCVITLITALGLQILANIINDYGDFIKGSDSIHRLGPPRAMQMGWIDRLTMERGIKTLILIIIIMGIPLILRGGFLILSLGVFGLLLCGWYTLGKRPLAYIGFSELVIFFVFGPMVVLGTYYVQTLSYSSEVMLGSLAPGFLSVALMLTNNLRDIVEDKKHNKKTIAVRLSETFSRFAIAACVFLALLSPFLLCFYFSYSYLILLSGFALLIPQKSLHIIRDEPISPRFNLVLASIGKSLYVFGALVSFGIIYGYGRLPL